jgi:hypothetical protein
MQPELENKLKELEAKLDLVYRSAEKSRKYLMWTGIITAAVIILPLIAMVFVLPSFISSYTDTLNSLGGL